MTIGNDLDEQFMMIAQRITTLENNQEMFSFREDTKDLRREVGDLNSEAATFATYAQLEQLETELNDRIDQLEDVDDLRCDLESQIEDVRDNVSYHDDRLDEVEAFKMTEEEVDYKIEEAISDRLDDLVCDAVNERAVPYNDFWKACERIRDLEDRLNKPSLSGRIVRWLREGPSIKEVATNWYAGIRRGS